MILPQSGITEAPQDHVVILVVPRVPVRDIMEQTMFFPEDLFCPVLHLPPLIEHVPYAAIPLPWDVEWE